MNNPTYVKVPLAKLPGCFLDVPVNRKARRIENRKNRQNGVKQRFVVTVRPLVLTHSGYYRTNASDRIWRESIRKAVKANKRRLDESGN